MGRHTGLLQTTCLTGHEILDAWDAMVLAVAMLPVRMGDNCRQYPNRLSGGTAIYARRLSTASRRNCSWVASDQGKRSVVGFSRFLIPLREPSVKRRVGLGRSSDGSTLAPSTRKTASVLRWGVSIWPSSGSQPPGTSPGCGGARLPPPASSLTGVRNNGVKLNPMGEDHHRSPYSAVVPPSMTSSLPVTYDDSSEARYSTP